MPEAASRPVTPRPATWQPSLLAIDDEPACDPSFAGARRRFLGSGAWLDVVPGWVRGADDLFDRLLAAGDWSTRDRPMYDRVVTEPRLTTGRWIDPPEPCGALAAALGARYGLDLSAVSANLYRDGADSVAWHGDTLGRHRSQTVVAIVSLGSPRRFLLRPKGGGPSIRLRPGHGDLLVLGGTCQHTWDHCVPKCSSAGSRISLMFREPGVF
jgi:alkylated DNA repair dioxygenase AlkB